MGRKKSVTTTATPLLLPSLGTRKVVGETQELKTIADLLGTVQQQDCIAGMNGIEPGTVDLVFADPPFNIGYDYDVYDDQQDRLAYLQWSRDWIAAVHRLLKPDGAFWLAIGDEYAAELKVLSQDLGFQCRSWVVWYYTFGVNCKLKFTRSHAHLFHFVKDAKKFTFRSAEPENRIPSARLLVYADTRANPNGRLPDDTWILRPQDLAECFTPVEDTWYFPRVAGTFKERAGFHGCQMPEQLLGRIIRSCTHENDVVVDPFSGSATTLVTARKLGRQTFGFELSPEYAKRGNERLSAVRVGDALDGAAEPLISAPSTPTNGRKPNQPKQKSVPSPFPTPAEADQRTKERAEHLTREGLIEAFRRTHQGYSLDRMLAEPELSHAFADACRSAGLIGDARSWNRALFRMRKAGLLSEIVCDKRTELSWEQCDRFVFASEIALRQLLDEGAPSLDDIFIEPDLALRFDTLAAELAPGFKAFDYRWAALKLRKEASFVRTRAAQFAPPRLQKPLSIEQLDWGSAEPTSGVYLVLGDDERQPLYAGAALDLRQRLSSQFTASAACWKQSSRALKIRLFLAERDPGVIMAYQSRLIGEYHPKLNFNDLAAV